VEDIIRIDSSNYRSEVKMDLVLARQKMTVHTAWREALPDR